MMSSGLDTPRLRLSVVGIVVLSLFAALVARLWYLQVMAAPTFQKVAEQNGVRVVFEEAPRGRILDRQGRVLVDNVVSQAITLDRASAKKHPDVVPRLAALLGMTASDVQKRIDDPRFSQYKPVPVRTGVDQASVIYVREHQESFPGVEAAEIPERHYPFGTLAAHLLGYVGEINDVELAAKRKAGACTSTTDNTSDPGQNCYRPGDTVGKAGVEAAYEADLRGQPGYTVLEVDSKGRVLQTLKTVPPVQGHDLVLTLDLDVQKLAEESLQQGLDVARATFDKSTKRNFAAPVGSVVVQDPRDGSILAMASNPSYDPTQFVGGISPANFTSLLDPAKNSPLVDRADEGTYAPGSTFKLATATAALEKGLITPGTTVNDTGLYKVPGCASGQQCGFKNAGGEALGIVDLRRAITASDDFYFYTQGANFWFRRGQFGTQPIQDQARAYGMGVKTGIPLPGEVGGRIADPDTRKRLHDSNPKAYPEGNWFVGDNVNLAIGQGETAITPLQLTQAYATFANGGTVYQPRVALKVIDQSGATVHDVLPLVTRKIDLPDAVRQPILDGLIGVTSAPRGTATGSFGGFNQAQFQVAGKTGTAQVNGKQDTALFVSFAPANNPQFVVTVVMEQAGFGGDAAAPVARRILQGVSGQQVTPIGRGTSTVD